MNYNAKRLSNKFTSMNTNKNKFLSLDEAIAAAIKQGSTLSKANRNRFSAANTTAPFGKLNMQEYQRMAKMKRGIATINNLRSILAKPKNVSTLPTPPKIGKLDSSKFNFLKKTNNVKKSYNAKTNGVVIQKQSASTLANANKNAAKRRSNLRMKNAQLRKSRNLFSGGKLNNKIAQFEFAPYIAPVYNTRPKNMPSGMSVKNRMKRFT